jgi:hypothetical protein
LFLKYPATPRAFLTAARHRSPRAVPAVSDSRASGACADTGPCPSVRADGLIERQRCGRLGCDFCGYTPSVCCATRRAASSEWSAPRHDTQVQSQATAAVQTGTAGTQWRVRYCGYSMACTVLRVLNGVYGTAGTQWRVDPCWASSSGTARHGTASSVGATAPCPLSTRE